MQFLGEIIVIFVFRNENAKTFSSECKDISCSVPKEKRTGKSLSEALIVALSHPQRDDRLFIELKVQYMKIPSSNLGRTCCVQKLF